MYEILYSKRLLIEHVEVLEECLYDIEGTMREDNFLNPICAGGLMLLSGVTSLFGKRFVFYGVTYLNSFQVSFFDQQVSCSSFAIHIVFFTLSREIFSELQNKTK